MQTDPDFLGMTAMPAHHSQADSKELHSGKFVVNVLAQGDRDIAGSEQCKGLGIWLQFDLEALLDGAESSEYAWELLRNRCHLQGVNLG